MSSDGAAGGGQLFVVSAPSGTGKTTVVERLVQVVPDLTMSRSYTSRPARAGGRGSRGWGAVSGTLSGPGRADAERLMASGKDVVLVIDVQGAGQVRAT